MAVSGFSLQTSTMVIWTNNVYTAWLAHSLVSTTSTEYFLRCFSLWDLQGSYTSNNRMSDAPGPDSMFDLQSPHGGSLIPHISNCHFCTSPMDYRHNKKNRKYAFENLPRHSTYRIYEHRLHMRQVTSSVDETVFLVGEHTYVERYRR